LNDEEIGEVFNISNADSYFASTGNGR